MNFDLSDEQSLLRDMIERFGRDRYDPAKRLLYVREPDGFDREGWAMLADAGLLAFPFAEALGGLGGGSVELVTVMEAIGRCAAVEPILPVVLMAGGVLAAAGSPAQVAELLPQLTSGERFLALAHFERANRFNSRDVQTRATRQVQGVAVTGAKICVQGGPFADDLIVTAMDQEGRLGLYRIDAAAAGIARRDYRLVDGSLASDLTFDATAAEPLAGGRSELDEVLVDVRLAICAELIGLMGQIFDATLEYVKTRRQFGQEIGRFQAIQHRMADNYAAVELSRSQLYRAAAQPRSGAGRAAAIGGAKAYISANAMVLGEDCIQLHGGVGTTDELMVGQAFRRVLLLSSLFGDADWETREYLRHAVPVPA